VGFDQRITLPVRARDGVHQVLADLLTGRFDHPMMFEY